jgi:hypothetical protein
MVKLFRFPDSKGIYRTLGATGNLLAEAGCSHFFSLPGLKDDLIKRVWAKKKTTKASPFHEDMTFVVFVFR